MMEKTDRVVCPAGGWSRKHERVDRQNRGQGSSVGRFRNGSDPSVEPRRSESLSSIMGAMVSSGNCRQRLFQ